MLVPIVKEITWNAVKQSLNVGTQVIGKVLRHESYGVFLDIGYDYEGLIQITDFKDENQMTTAEYPDIGEQIEAVVLGYKENSQQIWLGVKPSQLNKLAR